MKFLAKPEDNSAWLEGEGKCFGLIGGDSPGAPYACYYFDTSKGDLPYALTEKGLQIPTKGMKGKFFTYDELDRIARMGSEIAEIFAAKPND